MTISGDVHVLTGRDLDAMITEAFQRGVKRGRVEQRMEDGKEPVAMNGKFGETDV